MAKYAPDAMLDASLDYVAASTALHVCSSALPAAPTRADVLANSLATVVVDAADFAKSNGAVSGRRVTVAAQNAVPVTASGTAANVALIDGSVVRYVTTCTSQSLTSGNTVNIPAFDVELADPTV